MWSCSTGAVRGARAQAAASRPHAHSRGYGGRPGTDRARAPGAGGSCAEFLVHGVDVEGMRLGVDEELVRLLGASSPLPVTYAGGVRTLARAWAQGAGRVLLGLSCERPAVHGVPEHGAKDGDPSSVRSCSVHCFSFPPLPAS